jgi:hypothetical protein
MSENILSKSKLDYLSHHKTVFVVLPRNKANDYLLAHKFTEPEKNLLKKLRRNHQNKVCAQNYRIGLRDKIESLENTILVLKAQVQSFKEDTMYSQQQQQQHLHWKKRILQKEEDEEEEGVGCDTFKV